MSPIVTIRFDCSMPHEARDAEVDALEDRFGDMVERIQSKIEAESRRYDSLDAEYSSRKQEEIIGLGETMVNYFLGRRKTRLPDRRQRAATHDREGPS